LIIIISIVVSILLISIFLFFYFFQKVKEENTIIKTDKVESNKVEPSKEETKVIVYENPYIKKEMFDTNELKLVFLNEVFLTKDTDQDGLSDEAESKLGNNSKVEDFINFGLDTDADGLVDREEEKIGTDFKNQDSDEDDLSDWAEVAVYMTSPLKKDSNGNGIIDNQEQKIKEIQKKVLLSIDQDRDGITDEEEKKFGTNPKKRDTDGDSLLDGMEIILKYDPLVKDYILTKDTDGDGDGLLDKDEIKFHTSQTNRDTDGDGLLDYEEIMIYKTNPLNADSDKDGNSDIAEIKNNQNPNGKGPLPELPNYHRFTF
ncbi:hypothetical protein KKH16_00730, partial [Patescibacteria group bacterium]|nr:hypothetical protein [Patescibacteria group bacterium]MBU1871004.1 hypothetical protein [Patescibacteria group bacterium]